MESNNPQQIQETNAPKLKRNRSNEQSVWRRSKKLQKTARQKKWSTVNKDQTTASFKAVMHCYRVVFHHGSNQISIRSHSICSGVRMLMEETIDPNLITTNLSFYPRFKKLQCFKILSQKENNSFQYNQRWITINLQDKLYNYILGQMVIPDSMIGESKLNKVFQLVTITIERYDPSEEEDDFLHFGQNQNIENEDAVSTGLMLFDLASQIQRDIPATKNLHTQTTDTTPLELNEFGMDYIFTPQDQDYFALQIHQTSTHQLQEQNFEQQGKKEKIQEYDDAQDDPPEMRADGHNLSQNLSSMLVTSVAKLLSPNKAMKEQIKRQVKQFLKKGNGLNGQLALLFIYLYLLQQRVQQQVYEKMYSSITKYLSKRDRQAQKKSEEQKCLKLKINANRELSQLLFKDRYNSPLDFNEIQSAGSPLFGGRQKSVLKKIIGKASQIYQEITGQASPQSFQTNSLQIHTQVRYQ